MILGFHGGGWGGVSVRVIDLEGAFPSCSCVELGVRFGVTVDLKLIGSWVSFKSLEYFYQACAHPAATPSNRKFRLG